MAKVKQSGSMVMVITVCVLFVVGIITYITAKDVFKEVSVKNNKKYKVLIDSGHGGIDPGKVGVNGAYEKDINLAISLYLKEELQKKDCEVVMTRETDTGLYSEGDRSKKVADLKKRVELMNSEKPDAIVSIHQNSFTQESVHGAQTFYYQRSEKSKSLGEAVQQELNKEVNKEKEKKAKPNDSYYILINSKCPGIIVECGFLSNFTEAGKLVDESYQMQLAEILCSGIMNYFDIK